MWIVHKLSGKNLIILLLILALVGAAGCQDDNVSEKNDGNIEVTQQNRIIKADLTNREVDLIRGTGCDKYFVYDVKLVDEFSYVSTWVDKYEFGEMTEVTFGSMGTTLNKENKLFNLMMTTRRFMGEDELWVISFGGGTGSTSVNLDRKKMSTWQSAEEIEIIDGQEANLAVILFADMGSDERAQISGIPAEFFTCTENCEEFLKEYECAYVLKTKFSKAVTE